MELKTDASSSGLGAVLSQKQQDGHLHPLAYASRKLQAAEKNYGIMELETLGIVWAVKYFRSYLLGHKLVVYTDHVACASLLSCRNPSPKLARWAMIVQEMNLVIKHCPGKTNANADTLSRMLSVTEDPDLQEIPCPQPESSSVCACKVIPEGNVSPCSVGHGHEMQRQSVAQERSDFSVEPAQGKRNSIVWYLQETKMLRILLPFPQLLSHKRWIRNFHPCCHI